jgi:hypothetical protein
MKTASAFAGPFLLLAVCSPNGVHAQLMRQSHVAHCGDKTLEHRLVFDVANATWWYPDLMAMSQMTRDEQNLAIAGLNQKKYGAISEWRMASPEQVTAMKYSLADMANVQKRLPWDFSHIDKTNRLAPDPTLEDRTFASPKLAWEVKPQTFFTPTQRPGFKLFGKVGALTFNGRVSNEYWWRRNNDGSVTWSKGSADDHWMVLALADPEDFSFMVFNDDLHYLSDDATEHGFAVPGLTDLGHVGAWISSTNRPEAIGVEVIAGTEVAGDEYPVSILGREWFDVDQINPYSLKLAHCLVKSHAIRDVNGDGIADLAVVISTKGACLNQRSSELSGLLKDRYGPVAIRSCKAVDTAPSTQGN